jgi:hypothetical protein
MHKAVREQMTLAQSELPAADRALELDRAELEEVPRGLQLKHHHKALPLSRDSASQCHRVCLRSSLYCCHHQQAKG